MNKTKNQIFRNIFAFGVVIFIIGLAQFFLSIPAFIKINEYKNNGVKAATDDNSGSTTLSSGGRYTKNRSYELEVEYKVDGKTINTIIDEDNDLLTGFLYEKIKVSTAPLKLVYLPNNPSENTILEDSLDMFNIAPVKNIYINWVVLGLGILLMSFSGIIMIMKKHSIAKSDGGTSRPK